ncbi:golgin subfamily A member 4-like [Lepisosteus oculatus]|uniref:golgin subfamily A member 4-like n=1 Tax=Lepisosteus oculatus TaxID=7918 RepID=UPI00371D23FC
MAPTEQEKDSCDRMWEELPQQCVRSQLSEAGTRVSTPFSDLSNGYESSTSTEANSDLWAQLHCEIERSEHLDSRLKNCLLQLNLPVSGNAEKESEPGALGDSVRSQSPDAGTQAPTPHSGLLSDGHDSSCTCGDSSDLWAQLHCEIERSEHLDSRLRNYLLQLNLPVSGSGALGVGVLPAEPGGCVRSQSPEEDCRASTPSSELLSGGFDSSHTFETDSHLWAQLLHEVKQCEHLSQLTSEDPEDQSEPVAGQEVVSPSLKALLEGLSNEVSRILGLSKRFISHTALRTKACSHGESCQKDRQALFHAIHSLKELVSKLVFDKNMEELQSYLISTDRNSLLSEIENLKTEMRNVQLQHQDTVESLQQSLKTAQEEQTSRKCLLSEIDQLKTDLRNSQFQHDEKMKGLQLALDTAQDECKNTMVALHQTLKSSRDKVKALQKTLEASEAKSKATVQKLQHALTDYQKEHRRKVKTLIQALKKSREEHKEKELGLQQMLECSQEKVQVFQETLETYEVKHLREMQKMQQALEASQKKVQALQEILDTFKAKHNEEMLVVQQTSERSQEKVRALQEALDKREMEYQREMGGLQQTLEASQDKLQALQETLDKCEMKHEQEMQNVQQTLDRAMQQGATKEQELRTQVISLKTKLLQEKSKSNEELRKSVASEKEMQEDIRNLRIILKNQREQLEIALETLRQKQQEQKDIHCHLQADTQRCSQETLPERLGAAAANTGPPEQNQPEQPLPSMGKEYQHRARLREEYLDLRSSLRSLMESEGDREEQRRHGWRKLLEKTEEWERKAVKLVEGLDSKQCCQVSEVTGSEREHSWTVGSFSPPSRDTSASNRVPLAQSQLSSSQSHHRLRHSQDNTKPVALTASAYKQPQPDYIQHLLTVQKRIKGLQSVNFQNSVKDVLGVSRLNAKGIC